MALTTRLAFAALGLALAAVPFSRPSAAEAGGAGAMAAMTMAPAAVDVDKGRTLFKSSGCDNCHTLADAGATGRVGPALDGDTNLDTPMVINRVTNGQGAMPSFGGQISDADIATIAAYVVKVASK